MKPYYIIGALIICIATSLYLRIILPYDNIFTAEWIKFSGMDAYWQMAQVDRIAPDFPAYITQIFTTPLFVWVLSALTWCAGLGSPTQTTIDTVGVYFPAILGALTIIPVYFTGKAIGGRGVGVVAAIMITILPGEWLGRTMLGFTDHHVMEALLSTITMMFLIMALKDDSNKRYIYGALSALSLGLYFLAWTGAILFALIIITFVCVQTGINALRRTGSARYIPIVCIILPLILGATILTRFTDMSEYRTAISSILTGPTAATTMELQTLTINAAWGNFGFATLLIPAVLIILIIRLVKAGNANVTLLVVWTVATLVAMLLCRRFAYYFAINVALLTGWSVCYIWHRLKGFSGLFAAIVISIMLIAVIGPNTHMATAARSPVFLPSDAWHNTLEWMQENTPETVTWEEGEQEPSSNYILAWWDYGYWIERMARRKSYVHPGQPPERIAEIANMLLSSTVSKVPGDYLILDYATVNDKRGAIAIWAGFEPLDYNNTLMVRLYNGETVNGWTLVYESDQQIKGMAEVKVFKRETIEG